MLQSYEKSSAIQRNLFLFLTQWMLCSHKALLCAHNSLLHVRKALLYVSKALLHERNSLLYDDNDYAFPSLFTTFWDFLLLFVMNDHECFVRMWSKK